MRLYTKNLEHMKVLHESTKKYNNITVKTDQNFDVRITIKKDSPDELDSWLAINDVFIVNNNRETFELSEFDYITISDKLID